MATETINVVSDTHPVDLIPGEGFPWRTVVPKVHRISQRFGYQRVETSPIESLDVFSAYKDFLGLPADQYVRLETGTNKKFALRPQNFLSVLRAYIVHTVHDKERTSKWYYVAPTFVQEKNVFSHLYEYGVVHFGEPTAIAEAQLIALIKSLLDDCGVAHSSFEINNKGCEQCATYYHEVLNGFLQQNKFDLCPTCQQALGKDASRQPSETHGLLSTFNCQVEQCQQVLAQAPQIIDYLDASCNHHLTALLEALDELEVPYQLNPRFFGTHWYSHTLFRVNASLGPDMAGPELYLGIGGRHNRFVSRLASRDLSAVGFSLPLNAILQLVAGQGQEQRPERVADVFLINLGEMAIKKSLRLFQDLWRSNIAVAEQFGENGIKNQFKLAEKKGCAIALVIGQKEAMEGTVILRDVRSGIQEVFAYDRIIEEIKKRLQD